MVDEKCKVCDEKLEDCQCDKIQFDDDWEDDDLDGDDTDEAAIAK